MANTDDNLPETKTKQREDDTKNSQSPSRDSLIDIDQDIPTAIAPEPLTPTNKVPHVIQKQAPGTTTSYKNNNNPTQTTDAAQARDNKPTNEMVASLRKEPLSTIGESELLKTSDRVHDDEDEKQRQCSQCNKLQSDLDKIRGEKLGLQQTVTVLNTKLQMNKNELEREVKRRVDLEQRFTEEAKRTTDQIEELIAKSERDDTKMNELKRRFELYSRETSSMIENFTTSREVLSSQLLELRRENDHLLGKYLSKSRDLQSADIDLPQSVEDLQFHCLTLYEKLILATMAKERLEETLMQNTDSTTPSATTVLSATSTSTTTPTASSFS